MNEKTPSPESPNLRRLTLDALLKLKEQETDENREIAINLVDQWANQEEKKVLSGEHDNLDHNLGFAKLYEEAEMPEMTLISYNDALIIAIQEKNVKAIIDIKTKIQELKK